MSGGEKSRKDKKGRKASTEIKTEMKMSYLLYVQPKSRKKVGQVKLKFLRVRRHEKGERQRQELIYI